MPDVDMGDLAADLKAALEKKATSAKAWQQGDAAQSMWGVPIPSVAMSWVLGGCNKIPCQRYIGLSGKEKSYKSTLAVEIGNWFIQAGGMHLHLDNENKLGYGDVNTMVDAMTWWNHIAEKRTRVVKVCASVSEWQTQLSTFIEFSRTRINPREKGQRVPILGTIDSLTGRSTEDADKELRKEGFAPGRGFPVAAAAVTNYLEALNLLGTTATVNWVQHLKEQISEGGRHGYGPSMKEKGASAAQFACSVHMRLSRGESIRRASHPSAPFPGTVEGYEIHLRTSRTCVGPGDRRLCVPVLWQFVEDEQGVNRQVMWFDWHTALGELLWGMKYNKQFEPAVFKGDIEELDSALHFTQKGQNSISCRELGLEDETPHALGKAIETNPEVRAKVEKVLKITNYPSVQDIDIDFEAGDLNEAKKKRR